MSDTEVTDALKANAVAGVASARGDEGEVVALDPLKQIAVDKYLRNNAAVKRGLGIRLTRIVPPSATGESPC